jgi:hypothetical protein
MTKRRQIDAICDVETSCKTAEIKLLTILNIKFRHFILVIDRFWRIIELYALMHYLYNEDGRFYLNYSFFAGLTIKWLRKLRTDIVPDPKTACPLYFDIEGLYMYIQSGWFQKCTRQINSLFN